MLIVDDEADMRQLIAMYLHNSGYETSEAADDREVDEKLANNQVDLILLDIMLPEIDGFEICKHIRKTSRIPIIFLTAKGEEWDKVKGLQLGGDDYIVKPFSPGELVARIDAVLRRTSYENKSNAAIEYGVIKLDIDARTLTIANKPVNITYKEFELLKMLMSRPEKVYTREELLDFVWGIDYQGGPRTVDTHIKTLRMKMGKEAGSRIQTIWGSGYKFEVLK
ncbi:response regulator transcription factor [Bacillus sp. FJAT-50079]|uniref:response regulator transcription factor n=1 Tax=Bacillus sp. FJAT-50079 TaxID=2833577 RepID=UPI001BC962E3|nr:response regulator transcription factor [Bacillus sp. FJAT-50079]